MFDIMNYMVLLCIDVMNIFYQTLRTSVCFLHIFYVFVMFLIWMFITSKIWCMLFSFHGHYIADSRPISNLSSITSVQCNGDTSCKSHNRTVVQQCFNGDEAVNGKDQNATPCHIKTP